MGARALEHHQLPLRTTLVEVQNVQVAVVAFDLEVAIVWSIPLIDGFDDFDLAPAEPKAHRHFDPEMAGTALDLYLHGYPLPRRAWATRFFLSPRTYASSDFFALVRGLALNRQPVRQIAF